MTAGGRWAWVAAAALATAAGCRPGLQPPVPVKTSAFESPAWDIKLVYPADWTPRPGRGMEPLILKLAAPGKRETVGAGVSVVGFVSAAPLGEVAASFQRRLPRGARVSEFELNGYPARAFDYEAPSPEGAILSRAVVIRGNERFYVVTFAAYEPQYGFVKPAFEIIEKSLETKGD